MWSAPSSPPISGAAGSSEGAIREGFLCPLCLKDLQSVQQLQSHYEEAHSSEEDRHMVGHIKTLFGRAKRKLLKREGVDRVDSELADFVCSGGVDPNKWELQELGAMRNLRSEFLQWRGARIDHYVIEVNKLLIRLEKLTSFDRAATEPVKRKALEKSVVTWVSDRDVPCCPDCGVSFTLTVRRHHCRLCGSIMCRRCTQFLSVSFAQKLTKAVRASVTGGSAMSTGLESGRRLSVSSVSSLLEEKEDDRILSCQHCKGILEQRERRLDEKESSPVITQLYTKLHTCMESVEKMAPDYVKMAQSLNAGENTYGLETAANVRVELMKLYERIDLLSKRIASLGMSEVPPPHPKTVQLQRMIRLSTTQFLQEKLLGLTSLPTAEQFEELKKLRARKEAERWRESQGQVPAARPSWQEVSRDSGWLASSSSVARELGHPLLEQMANIECFLAQARSAGRLSEARTLEENLQQLQDEWDRMQKEAAQEDERSRRKLEAYSFEEGSRKPEAYSFEEGSRKPEAYSFEEGSRKPEACSFEEGSRKPEAYTFEEGSRKPEAYSFKEGSMEEERSRRKPEAYQASPFNNASQPRGGLNPFEEDTEGPNPFKEEETNWRSPSTCPFEGNSEVCNPFEEVEASQNLFEEQERSWAFGGNPFEVEEDIEEELLRQQIDNIKAYVFDAKQAGRLDEMASLLDNLAELKQALEGVRSRHQAH